VRVLLSHPMLILNIGTGLHCRSTAGLPAHLEERAEAILGLSMKLL